MKKTIISVFILLLITIPALSLDFFSTASVETFYTEQEKAMVSPNIFFTAGKFDGYGFLDRYLDEFGFYYGEFLLGYTPFEQKYWNKISFVTETRWAKAAKPENSIGLRIKLW